jgi:hypothetical protein
LKQEITKTLHELKTGQRDKDDVTAKTDELKKELDNMKEANLINWDLKLHKSNFGTAQVKPISLDALAAQKIYSSEDRAIIISIIDAGGCPVSFLNDLHT